MSEYSTENRFIFKRFFFLQKQKRIKGTAQENKIDFFGANSYTFNMNANREPLKNRLQTARRIKHLCEQYYRDLTLCFVMKDGKQIPLSDLSLKEYFDFVRQIPYRRDPRPIEIVARPYYIIKHRSLGMDCKKKGTLICSFLRIKNYKYRAIGSSSRPDGQIHHIYFELYDPKMKQWKTVDATYPDYKLFEIKTEETNREVLK